MHNSHGEHIGDHAYGLGNVRNLRKIKDTQRDAVVNADSYAYFALVRLYFWCARFDVWVSDLLMMIRGNTGGLLEQRLPQDFRTSDLVHSWQVRVLLVLHLKREIR